MSVGYRSHLGAQFVGTTRCDGKEVTNTLLGCLLPSERSLLPKRPLYRPAFTPPVFNPSKHLFHLEAQRAQSGRGLRRGIASRGPAIGHHGQFFGELGGGLGGNFAVRQIHGSRNMALLEILSTAGINEQKAVLPPLQIQHHIRGVRFNREFGEKMAMGLFRASWWRLQDQRKMGGG